MLKLDQYLDSAFMKNLYQVKIIHGRGTGTLRQEVQKMLNQHPLIESYRPGGYGEGGAGVTIVKIAKR